MQVFKNYIFLYIKELYFGGVIWFVEYEFYYTNIMNITS